MAHAKGENSLKREADEYINVSDLLRPKGMYWSRFYD
jgi:hypothetical protein